MAGFDFKAERDRIRSLDTLWAKAFNTPLESKNPEKYKAFFDHLKNEFVEKSNAKPQA